MEQGANAFSLENARVRNIVLKLSRGHAAFELHTALTEEPSALAAMPLAALNKTQRENFDHGLSTTIWPEVGSRAMQRLVEDYGHLGEWVVVQPGRYRYLTIATEVGAVVRIVLSDHFACEVQWSSNV
jgi:hypothetical protein